MKFIKNYNLYVFENVIRQNTFNDSFIDILESMVVDTDELLKIIDAQEVDLFITFRLNPDLLESNFTIDDLYNNIHFNKSLLKKNLKKSKIESNDDSETFIDDDIIVKFFTIYKMDATEIDKPEYIIIQTKKRHSDTWDIVKCYKVNKDMKNFYNKLTTKTIEIKKGDEIYIYVTSNSGNDWKLQKSITQHKDKRFKEYMSSEEIKKLLLDDKDIIITIID